ncbi:MAG: PQQ-binding-like beta-propeller repeat protein, partial [bacterium]
GTRTFSATGYDVYNNQIPGLTFTWHTLIGSISPTSGTQTLFTGTTTPTIGTLSASFGSITGYATITLEVGTLSYIIITPASATLTVAGTRTFSATGYDVYNNQIAGLIFTWHTLIGSVSPTSGTQTLFTGTTTPTIGTLSASFGSITGYATVTLEVGTLSYIIIEPASVTLTVNGTRTFTAKGYDEFHNFIEDLTFNWTANVGSVSPTVGTLTLFTATTTGVGSLTVWYDLVSTYATITVKSGTLSYIVIEPATATLGVNGTLTFTATGYDDSGTPIPELIFTWSFTIGSISNTSGTKTLFMAGTKTGIGSLTAAYGTITSYATITIIPGTLTHIFIYPASATLIVGGTRTFTAKGYDEYGNNITELSYSWQTIIGSVNPTSGTWTLFIGATTSITGTLTASYGAITGFATITLEAGTLSYIIILPNFATLTVCGTRTFTATGYDEYGNTVELSSVWATDIGSISPTTGTKTLFTAGTKALTGTLTLTSNSVTGVATITITPGTITFILITPATATVSIEGSKTFTACGYDEYNNYIDGLIFDFSVSIGTITPTIGTKTTFTAGTTTKTGTLTVTFGTITNVATITILPGTLTYIIIAPATATVSIGGTRTFTAKGYDSHNNLIENLIFNWQTFIGSISPTTGTSTLFTAGTKALTGTLAVSYGNVITCATITIPVGTLNYIIITPGSYTIIVEGSHTFTAQGYDSYGNLILGLIYTWSTAIGSVSPTIGTKTTFTAGTQSVTGTLAVVSDSIWSFATITITTGGLHHIIITPATGTVSVDGTISFTAQGYDQFNTPLDGLIYTWHTVIGSVSPTQGTSTTFTAGTNSQIGTLTVTSGSITTSATITITPGTISSIVINPATASVQFGYTRIFIASGYDQYGNSISNLTYNWSVTIGTISPVIGGTTTFTAGMTSGVGTLTATHGIVTQRATITVTGLIHMWPMWRVNRSHTGITTYPDPTTVVNKWAYNIGKDIYSSAAIGHDGVIYFGTIEDNGKLYAINSDGTAKWASPYSTIGPIYSSPALGGDGVIYVGEANVGYLYAINSDGTWKWQYQTGGPIYSSPVISSNGTIYFGSNDNKIYALAPDKTLVGSYSTGGDIHSSPAIGTDGTIYVGSVDGKIYALTSDLSTLMGSYTTGGAIYSSPAIAQDGTVYVGSDDNKIYALSSDLSVVRGSYLTDGDIRSSPAIGTDGTIYVGSVDGKIYALTSDLSTLRGSYTTGGAIYSSPAIGGGGMVYIGSDDDKLYAFDSLLNLKWSYTTGGDVRSSPSIGSGSTTIYVNSYDDKLYAFRDSAIHHVTITPGSVTIELQGTSTFSAQAYDSSNKPILNATYSWQLSSPIVGNIYPSTGISTLFTANNMATRTTTLIATSDSLQGVATITINPGTASKVIMDDTTNNQSAAAGASLPKPFKITVTDQYNNGVPNISIQFTITAVPSGAAGYFLYNPSNSTDVNGEAKALLVLGNKQGTYTVLAQTPGLSLTNSPATFTAFATPPTARLSIEPSTKGVSNGEIFDLDIQLANVFRLRRASIYLKFNPGYLEVQDANPSKSGIQITQGPFPAGGYNYYNLANNGSGTILYKVLLSSGSADGTGTLASIRFKALQNGSTTITFDLGTGTTITELVDPETNPILFTIGTGTVTIGQGEVKGAAIIYKPPFGYSYSVYHHDILISAPFGTTTTTANGQFHFPSVSPGTYIATATTPGAIKRYWPSVVVVAGQVTDVGTKTLYTGDANQNGQFDIPGDIDAIIASMFNSYDPACDCNRDGVISDVDIDICVYNYDNNNPPPYPAPPLEEEIHESQRLISLTVIPEVETVKVGNTFTVTVKLNARTNIRRLGYYLAYNPALLEVVDSNSIAQGRQLKSTSVNNGIYTANGVKDGKVCYIALSFFRATFFEPNILNTITFKAKAKGTTLLFFTQDTSFINSNWNLVEFTSNQVSIDIVGDTIDQLSTSLKDAYAYPNPSYTDEVCFAGLTENTTIRIYTIAGELVYEQEDFDKGRVWRCRNLAGERVASGIYIYILTNDKGEIKKGKIGIIR